MWLVHIDDSGALSLAGPFHDNIPDYATLSHKWLDDEVTFEDFAKHTAKDKPGYAKLQFCANQARRDSLRHFWIDTCCINRSSDAELTESINSMFRWYSNAKTCYVYLHDVPSASNGWEVVFAKSVWFTRGWTLQELLAPRLVEFFACDGHRLGDKKSLNEQIREITGIPISALLGQRLSSFNVNERMQWAATRGTTREEDSAYCLLGIFEVSMPVVYGEGRKNAIHRLEKEIYGFIPKLVPDSNIPFRRDQGFIDVGIIDDLLDRCSVPASRIALVGLGGIGYV